MRRILLAAIASLASAALVSCGGGGGGGASGGSSGTPSGPATFVISGVVSGLGSGKQVTLLNNSGNSTTVTANGSFSFSNPIASNGNYAVTVGSQPVGQVCTVSNGTGTGIVANVSNVQVSCKDDTYTVSGTVSGLGSGKQLILQNNLSDSTTLSANGGFRFNTNVPLNGSYSVTVSSQPTGQMCTVSNGTGSGVTANISNVQVTCSDNSYSVGGTLSGLRPGLQVTLLNNGVNSTTVASNGSFIFSTSIAHGSNYAVTVGTQPAGQSCAVTSGSGSGVVSNVSNVQVSCTDVSLGGLTTRFSLSGDSGARGTVVQPDGKIVVAGGAGNGPASNDFAVARYNSNGTLDTSFSGDGLVMTNIYGRTASTDSVRGVALQTDGKLVVVGYTTESGSGSYGLAVARYNSDGSLDATFSGDGIVTKYETSGARNMYGHAVAIQSDGKILVAGAINCVDKNTPGYCTLLARFNIDGSFDAAFDAAFFARQPDDSTLGAAGLVMQSDGKILVAGTRDSGSGESFAVARYTANGSRDTSFGTNGVATVFISTEVGSKDSGTSIALQPDGKIIVAGGTYTLSANVHFGVARFLSDGRIDMGFGTTGVLTTNISRSAESDNAWSVAVQADGKILVAGDTSYVRSNPFPYPGFFSAANIDFAVVRYNANGTLDTTFSTDGIATTDFRLLTDNAYNVIVGPNGSILLSGSSFTHDPGDTVNGGYWSFAVARYNADGSPDQTFKGGNN